MYGRRVWDSKLSLLISAPHALVTTAAHSTHPMMEPEVSEPMAKATRPAAVAAPGPAEDPDAPAAIFQGVRVLPPHHWLP